MATVILAAVGAAIGGSVGGGLAGISSVAIGRLAGATVGRLIDQSLMGQGSDVVETGKVDRFRLTGSAEGAVQAQLFGRVRVAGQVIWATRFVETVTETGGGKGAPSQPKTRSYSYSVSLAIALGEGAILSVGRMWADGVEVAPDDFNMRVYRGDKDQLPDPKIEAVEGVDAAPAYRGTAYVVLEDLQLERFGNRVPQFNFEVVRATPEHVTEHVSDYSHTVRAVALMPGTGEYALATTPVYVESDAGTRVANENSPSGKTDFVTSMEAMSAELPKCEATSLVVSWFGNDLRSGQCTLRPKVEALDADGSNMPWAVSGETRSTATAVARIDGRPVYGGTPADASVVEAIRHLSERGTKVTFYPFILMEQMEQNGLNDPWSGADHQPVLPWRGRITLSSAPGMAGSPDGSEDAAEEVAEFFGTASVGDFHINGDTVSYSGPQEWSYRRFILHYAALCAASGGVEAFCIGSEMRGLTQIRSDIGFPAVDALRTLAADVRTILGADVKIGYAADWSEYFGYHPQDGTGDVYFHLDPLWADPNIDFVGIDNYMPVSDWRDGDEHADAQKWSSLHDVEYLRANIAGAEGFDWYYHSPEARDAQIRTPIEDGMHGEPWVFRFKDLRSWWSLPHHERIGGVRQSEKTDWEPMSKPIWFTEVGCAAIDKGTNQPNKFLDEKSSESAIPHFSNGLRDDHIQQLYLQALFEHFSDVEQNPGSETFGGPMVDVDRMFVWAWDARPFPMFPNAREIWSDGANYAKGHWVNGRTTNRTLSSVVAEICWRSGVEHYDVTGLHGVVRGFMQTDVSDARAALQPLMLRHGFDAIERDGCLYFVMRGVKKAEQICTELLAVSGEVEGDLEFNRQPDPELAGRVRVNFILAERDFDATAEEAILHDEATFAVAQSETQEVLTRGEGRQTAERWLSEARVARDKVKLALPPSRLDIGPGDVVAFAEGSGVTKHFRLDRTSQQNVQILEGTRTEANIYEPSDMGEDVPRRSPFTPPVPVQSLFLDVPLMTGEEVPHAPHIAVTARPWPGSVAVYDSASEDGFVLNRLLEGVATVGVTENALLPAPTGLWDDGEGVLVKLQTGVLRSVSELDLLNGKNLAFVGDGQPDGWESFQFQNAELVGPDQYLLTRRLRGQLGTSLDAPKVWPAGSWVVAMSPSVVQLDLQLQLRTYARNYRIGPATRALDDPTYRQHSLAFSGVGLRPYPVAHLRGAADVSGNLTFNWVRQTRFGGDSWETVDVPLAEEAESYLIRVQRGGTVIRETLTDAPSWIYTSSMQLEDGFSSGDRVAVAQISAVYGAGAVRSLAYDTVLA